MSRRAAVAVLAGLVPFLAGWDHVLSPEAYFSVSPGVEYWQVRESPETYPGVTLMLAGAVAECTSGREGTTLEIVCYTRDRDDRPEQADPACGRFLAKTSQVWDPQLYAPGRVVTLSGTLRGTKTLPLGKGTYEYLVFEIGEIYLWPREEPHSWRSHPWCGGARVPLCDPCWDPFCRPFGGHLRLQYRWRDRW